MGLAKSTFSTKSPGHFGKQVSTKICRFAAFVMSCRRLILVLKHLSPPPPGQGLFHSSYCCFAKYALPGVAGCGWGTYAGACPCNPALPCCPQQTLLRRPHHPVSCQMPIREKEARSPLVTSSGLQLAFYTKFGLVFLAQNWLWFATILQMRQKTLRPLGFISCS